MTASPTSGSPPPPDALRAKHDAAVEHANWMRDHLTVRDMDGISAVNLGWRLRETLDREAALLARVDDLTAEVARLRTALSEIAAVPDFRADDPIYTRDVARAALSGGAAE